MLDLDRVLWLKLLNLLGQPYIIMSVWMSRCTFKYFCISRKFKGNFARDLDGEVFEWVVMALFSLCIGGTFGMFAMFPLYLLSEKGMDRDDRLSLTHTCHVLFSIRFCYTLPDGFPEYQKCGHLSYPPCGLSLRRRSHSSWDRAYWRGRILFSRVYHFRRTNSRRPHTHPISEINRLILLLDYDTIRLIKGSIFEIFRERI